MAKQSSEFSSVGARAEQRGSTQGSDALKQQLLGSGKGQMNLQALRERGLALRKSIEDFIEILHYQPHLLTWENSLKQFLVMGVRHQQLVDQLSPLLKFYVSHPKAVNQANADIIPLLLSTMKLPEMEAEEQQLLQNNIAQSSAKSLYEDLGDQVEAFNQLLRDITEYRADQAGSGILDPKGPQRGQISQDLKKAINEVEISSAAEPDNSAEAKALLAAAMTGEGLS